MTKCMLLGAVVLAFLPSLAGAGVTYQYDDGTAETYGGVGANMYLAWMVRYAVQPGGEQVHDVRICLPAAVPCEAVVWEDIGGHGDPADARVLSRTPFTGVTGWNTIPMTPVTVSGYFFVGAYNYGASAPMNGDSEGYQEHRSWLSADANDLDLNRLTAAPYYGWFEDFDPPIAYVAMVRAQATPEPATLVFLAAGSIAVIVRRTRNKEQNSPCTKG